jgi:hypothetical protein
MTSIELKMVIAILIILAAFVAVYGVIDMFRQIKKLDK